VAIRIGQDQCPKCVFGRFKFNRWFLLCLKYANYSLNINVICQLLMGVFLHIHISKASILLTSSLFIAHTINILIVHTIDILNYYYFMLNLSAHNTICISEQAKCALHSFLGFQHIIINILGQVKYVVSHLNW